MTWPTRSVGKGFGLGVVNENYTLIQAVAEFILTSFVLFLSPLGNLQIRANLLDKVICPL